MPKFDGKVNTHPCNLDGDIAPSDRHNASSLANSVSHIEESETKKEIGEVRDSKNTIGDIQN